MSPAALTEPARYFRPDDGGFRVRFPYIPHTRMEFTTTQQKGVTIRWAALQSAGTHYVVAYADIPEDSWLPDRLRLEAFGLGLHLHGETSVTETERMRIENHPATRFVLSIGDETVAQVVVIRNRRLIIVGTSGPAGWEDSEPARAFLQSLVLDP